MSRRRRLNPPWIPGFWLLVVFLLLISSVGGYYYLLSKSTAFEKRPDKVEATTAAK